MFRLDLILSRAAVEGRLIHGRCIPDAGLGRASRVLGYFIMGLFNRESMISG